ncbi:hypothetical protein BpHYR1_028590 [Brachionus plicatilis]|uniref:Uncharacterized protein n=1 Tax=Brachionus plicatilis TaxID=10195 RepID=A0A3M7R500_BRAPC|nr:hypothetical protein BpHYR1_028590 [Brachionus plicatilis]
MDLYMTVQIYSSIEGNFLLSIWVFICLILEDFKFSIVLADLLNKVNSSSSAIFESILSNLFINLPNNRRIIIISSIRLSQYSSSDSSDFGFSRILFPGIESCLLEGSIMAFVCSNQSNPNRISMCNILSVSPNTSWNLCYGCLFYKFYSKDS